MHIHKYIHITIITKEEILNFGGGREELKEGKVGVSDAAAVFKYDAIFEHLIFIAVPLIFVDFLKYIKCLI